jgi:archaellum biogenesis ATPase FlaH
LIAKAKVKLSQEGTLIIPPDSGMYEVAKAASIRDLAGIVDGICPLCQVGHFKVDPEQNLWCCSECADERWHGPLGFVMRRDDIDAEEAVRRLNENDGSEKPSHSREVQKLSSYRLPQNTYDAQLAPFHNREAEEALVGSALIHSDVLDYAQVGLVRPEHFFLEGLGCIWQAALDLHSQEKPIDLITITAQLESSGNIDKAGVGEITGAAYLTVLIDRTPSSVHASEYAAIVLEKAGRRKLEQTAQQFHKAASNRENGSVAGLALQARETWDAFRAPAMNAEDPEWVNFGQWVEEHGEEEVTWHLDGAIQQGSLGVLFGRHGVGKSLAAADLVLATCFSGTCWGIEEPVKPGPVLLASGDAGRQGTVNGLMRLIRGRGTQSPPDNLTVTFVPKDLHDPDELARMETLIRTNEIVLVVIDALSVHKPGDLSEYGADDMSEFMRPFLDLRSRYGTTFLIVHHQGWTDNRLRGSTAIGDRADFLYHVTGKGKGIELVSTIKNTKMRGEDILRPDREFGLVRQDAGSLQLAWAEVAAGQGEQKLSKYDQAIQACRDHLIEAEGAWVSSKELIDLCAAEPYLLAKRSAYQVIQKMADKYASQIEIEDAQGSKRYRWTG